MATPSVKKFVELIKNSKLVPYDQLLRTLTQCQTENGGTLPTDVHQVADYLIEHGLLTRWHCQNLLNRKYKGFIIGNYKLLGLLGSGGMSKVYLAEHILMHRRQAVKVLPKVRVGDSSYLERFVREAQSTARLDHPNIVRVYDVDKHGETHYMVMEHVDGRDLQMIVSQGGALPFRQVADYIAQAADGLAFAHAAGLIHRDVKPANLLIDSKNVLKLLDLGLVLDHELESLTLAYDENVLGTADYLSPEQAVDSHSVDKRADIYSLGCSMYFLLTGHAPFPDGSIVQRIIKHQREMPADILKDRPDCPGELRRICTQMMQKDPDHRPQSMEQVAAELRNWLQRSAAATARQPEKANSAGAEQTPETAIVAAARRQGDAGGQEAAAQPRGQAPAQRRSQTPAQPRSQTPAQPRSQASQPLSQPLSDPSAETVSAAQPTVKGLAGSEAAPLDATKEAPSRQERDSIALGIDVAGARSSTAQRLSKARRQRFDIRSTPLWVWLAFGLLLIGGLVVIVALVIGLGLL